jgi:hypothetical protein
MSVKASFWAIEQTTLPLIHKLVLMLWPIGPTRTDWPFLKQITIADKAMCSVRHVIDTVRELQQDGYLTDFLSRNRPNGQRGSRLGTAKLA